MSKSPTGKRFWWEAATPSRLNPDMTCTELHNYIEIMIHIPKPVGLLLWTLWISLMNQRSCSKGGVKTPSVHHPNQDLKNVQTITTQPYTTWKHNHSSQHQYARLGTTLTLNMAVMLQSRSLVPTQPMPHSPTTHSSILDMHRHNTCTY